MIGIYTFGFILGVVIVGALVGISLLVYALYDYLFPACYFCDRRIGTKRVLIDFNVLDFIDIGYHFLCLAYAEKTQTEIKVVSEIKQRIEIKDHKLRVKKENKDHEDMKRFKKKVMHSEFRDLAHERGLDFIIDKDKEDRFDKQLH